LFTDQHLPVKYDICFHWKSSPEFNPLTQKIQITKARNFKKWLREEVLYDFFCTDSSYIYAKEKAFLQEDAINVPRKFI